MALTDLVALWRERATLLRAYGAEASAVTLSRCADDLEAALGAEAAALLTLAEAAEVSGFSRDHIGRLVREGRLPNHAPAGHRPLVRPSDLPRKAPAVHDLGARRTAAEVVALHLHREGTNGERGA